MNRENKTRVTESIEKKMSNGNVIGAALLIIVGVIFIIVGAAILGASSDIKTSPGSIEDALMKVPKVLGIGFILGGILLIVIALLWIRAS